MASTPYSDINLPKFVTDPLYTESQDYLHKLGTGILGGNIPDYYKPIGEFNSPQFQAMLNAVKGQVMQGSQEAAALQGTGRSGTAINASNDALSKIIPNLNYADYTRALAGRGALFNAGADIESGVRGAAQQQGINETNFNQTLWEDQMKQAGAIDAYKKSAAQSQGQMWGQVGGLALGALTGGLGLLPGALAGGGLTGAIGGGLFGAGMGGSMFGGSGDNGMSTLFSSLYSLNPRKTSTYGVGDASLGTFNSLKGATGSGGNYFDQLLESVGGR